MTKQELADRIFDLLIDLNTVLYKSRPTAEDETEQRLLADALRAMHSLAEYLDPDNDCCYGYIQAQLTSLMFVLHDTDMTNSTPHYAATILLIDHYIKSKETHSLDHVELAELIYFSTPDLLTDAQYRRLASLLTLPQVSPEELMECYKVLEARPSILARIKRVAKVVEGFNNPSSLELLRMVYCIKKEGAKNVEEACDAIKDRNRTPTMLTPEQTTKVTKERVRAVWQRLSEINI